jgi:carboxypeptidase Q
MMEYIMRRTFILVGIAFLAFVPASLTAQSAQDATAIQAVRAVADAVDKFDPNQFVQILIQRFGPRQTGSDSEHKSATWALDEMRRAGLSDVHTETWTLHRGWKRLHAAARLTKPYETKLEVASYGWSGSTHGGVSGEVVLVDGNATLTKEAVRNWRGKIVLVAPISKDGIRGVADAPVLANWAEKAHAVAVIDGITRPGGMLHTGPIGFPGRESSVPILDMPEMQRQQLEHLVKQGAKPNVSLDIANRFTDGPISVENVIGEIKGAVHPEQVVLVGAHLDSWDLSPGATDDGTGVAAVIAAARAIHASGVLPDRTIRFVLFTGEEQGLLGSQAYVEQHRAELSHFVCALVMDWGAGPITRFPLAGHPELEGPLTSLFQADEAFKSIKTSSGFLTFTDGFAFTFAGLPGIGLLQDSPDYDRDAHSTEDSLGAVNAPALRFNTRVLASSAIWLADVKQRPGSAFTQAENEQALRPVRSALEMLGVWPYERSSSPMLASPTY